MKLFRNLRHSLSNQQKVSHQDHNYDELAGFLDFADLRINILFFADAYI